MTGQVENCQVAVYLAYTTGDAHALKERAVLAPEQAWQKRSAGAGSKGERFHD